MLNILNPLDLIILGIIILIMMQSYRAGFLDEFLSLAVFLISGYLAYLLYPYLIPFLDFVSMNALVLKVSSIAVLFITFFIIGKIAKSFLLDIIDETELNGFDKMMGMLLGLFKGIVIVSAILLVLSYIEVSSLKGLLNTSVISNKILYAISKYREFIII